MPVSPDSDTDGPVRVSITCDGTEKSDLPVVSVTVRQALNSIPWARLVIADGDMPTGKAPLSDGALFKPGAAIVVKAGYGDEESEIFSGIVVRHGFRITGNNYSRLEVECRHSACKMTLGRKSAHYVDQTDSAVIETLIGNAGLTADVSSTSVTHKELVQHHSSDWDFMLARADVMGLVVQCTSDKVSVKAPDFTTAAELSVTWGVDLIDFSADIDARQQWKSVQANSWSPSQQGLLQGAAASPLAGNSQGNLDGSTLAAVASPDVYALQSAAPQTKDVLDAWAKAAQLKATLARVRGRLSFQGNAKALPGTLLTLAGVGERFSGDVYLSAVQHEIAEGNWLCRAEFGLPPDWHMERPDVRTPANGGLVPGIRGLHIGVVMKLDEDPEGEQRIQVQLPYLQVETPGIWARLVQGHASNSFGQFFVPEVGDEVVLGFFNDDPGYPVILGSLYSSNHTPPYALEAENNTKAIVTRCQHRIEFNEKDKIITIETPSKNTMVLNDNDKSVLLKDQNGNSIKLSSDGIALDSPKDIKVTAQGGITLTATTGLKLDCQADIQAQGMNITAQAQVGFTGKGSATAELSAAGQTTVKGAMVMIN
ncbi:type VI secretion system tip protein VgrG [Ideonella sp. DXS29W]|uniref:Type VI secretion system tip protein VgrG n=1 Tax=Ideonella lacteola TaxID=2984193 RepID=A0ABU9BXA8_9BURK